MLRLPPRVSGSAGLIGIEPGETTIEAAKRLAAGLERGVLPVQGPPDSGKTFTGARMAVELVRLGKRVGVAATGHRVMRNFLHTAIEAAAEAGVDLRCGHRTDPEDGDSPEIVVSKSYDNLCQGIADRSIGLLAGTSWLWARPDYAESVDVLFIDEAGQMSLADVLVCARGAESVVLLGDPQQLDQPQQGSHPEGTHVSALQHLLEEAETLPEGAGLFLGETYRLHPALCAFTSELFYEGRLQPVPGLEKQELAGPVLEGAGLWYLAVEHEGNQSSSAEEVGAVGALVERLTDGSTEWTDKEGGKMRLRLDQILIVAPYNAQVDALKERLSEALLNLLLKIEEERGRTRSQQTEARTLDLDLLLYGQEVITTDGLAIPHPRMHERAFVLIPLAEVSPQTRHPLLSTQIGVLADEVPDKETVNLFEQNWWRYDGNLEDRCRT